nr:MAG TPA: hypothetical protein [Caudoviricetes sp.]
MYISKEEKNEKRVVYFGSVNIRIHYRLRFYISVYISTRTNEPSLLIYVLFVFLAVLVCSVRSVPPCL